MYLDYAFEFSNGQVVTVSAPSEQVMDLGAANSPHSTADQVVGDSTMFLVVVIDIDFASTASFDISLRSNDNVDLTTGSPVTHCTRNLALADLKVATAAKSPTYVIGAFGGQASMRYLGVYYTVNTTADGGGALSAYLVKDPQQNIGGNVW